MNNATRFAALSTLARHEHRIANRYAEASELGFDSCDDIHPDSAWILEGVHRVRANKAASLADRFLARTAKEV